jgi:hypothetical protein
MTIYNATYVNLQQRRLFSINEMNIFENNAERSKPKIILIIKTFFLNVSCQPFHNCPPKTYF